MANPTTRQGTPPASGRIGQQTPTSTAVILPAYYEPNFPGIGYTYQLALDLTTNTLVYYNANGAWRGIVSASDVQTFYSPTTPTTTNLFAGDRWFNTATGIWNVWSATKSAWIPGAVAYSATAPTSPTPGQAWYDTSTQTLKLWNGTAWVADSDAAAPGGPYTGALPNGPVTLGSTWTDVYGVQYVCTTAYAAGAGNITKWTQITIGADPLVSLIATNGQLIIAQEASTAAPLNGPSTRVPITTGLVWLDITTGSAYEGKYFVYTGTRWQQVLNPSTLVLCAGLKVSQNAQGIVGTNLNYIWPDSLATQITVNSLFATAPNSSNSAAPGPQPYYANVTAYSVSANVATLTLSQPQPNFFSGRPITVAGLAASALNGSWTIQTLSADSLSLTYAVTTADVANTAGTGTVTEPWQIGDVGEDEAANEWFVWTRTGTPSNTWADWTKVTNPSTVALCATIATQVLPSLISQRCSVVGQDIATGLYQNVPADLNAMLGDVLAYTDAQYQRADLALSNYAVASGSWVQQSVLYFSGPDQPLLANVSGLGVSLMNTQAPADIQALASVTDQGFTGSGSKIAAANFLSTYTTARGTLL